MGKRIVLIGLAVLMLLSALAEANARHSRDRQVGWASWYGAYHHGRQTASGERFSMWELTAAHRWLPLGTKALVTNLDTGQQVKVTITDRGPYVDPQHRIIDLSRAAAARVGLLQRGGRACARGGIAEAGKAFEADSHRLTVGKTSHLTPPR
jgi:rare lipoprotein A